MFLRILDNSILRIYSNKIFLRILDTTSFTYQLDQNICSDPFLRITFTLSKYQNSITFKLVRMDIIQFYK